MRRSNTMPWSDGITLVKRIYTADSDGYESFTETQREAFADFADGVSRAEFYEAQKSGHELSATVEVLSMDYDNEDYVRHNGTLYHVVRSFPASFDTVTLVLEEVVH